MENLRFLNTVIELHRPMMTCNEHYIIMTFHYPLIESGFLLINDKKMKTELFNMNLTEAVFFVDYVRGPYQFNVKFSIDHTSLSIEVTVSAR